MSYISVAFTWDGEAMRPNPRFVGTCNKQYVVGEEYRLDVIEERSAASHSHFFAAVNEAWKNLPHDIAPRFPTADKLRRWCLIKAGFANEQSLVCQTVTDAARFASMIGRMNDDAIIVTKGPVVKVYTAKSQSLRSMDKAEFQRSKEATLALLAEMIGTSAKELSDNAGRAA